MGQFPEFTPVCPEGVYEKIIAVTEKEVDRAGYMHPAELARQMQIITEEHFDACSGMTIEQLNQAGLSWIIAWTQMQVERLPKKGETLRLRIWPSKKKAVMHARKYAFYTYDGEPLVTTASLFLIMDQKTRTAAGDPEGLIDLTPVVIPGEPKPPKMNLPFPEEYERLAGRTVEADEIDYNGHMNNSHYLDWTEALPEEHWLREHALKTVWVEYSSEMTEGETAGMYYAIDQDGLHVKGVSAKGQSFRLLAECEADGGAHLNV
ncbi:MAG: hypothetical protein E7236_01630 [Lachnospiraceae bacterium]|nr:hypothetical protein [Lachnospiraceae bacterium]